MKRKRRYGIGAAVIAAVGALFFVLEAPRWPEDGEASIENMANIIRRIERPARWCYPTRNPISVNYTVKDDRFTRCLRDIRPASDYIGWTGGDYPNGDYIKRFYRAEIEGYFCEVTLSKMNRERMVGSDCYFGLFREGDDTGLGMTDDPFG